MVEPTDDQRETVGKMVAWGIPQPTIAGILEIDEKTLRKHFRRELDEGLSRAIGKVAGRLFKTATEGVDGPAVTAGIFFLKTRAKWSERLELTGAGGEDLFPEVADKRVAALARAAAKALDRAQA